MKVVKLSFRNTQLNDIMTVGDVQQVRDQLYKNQHLQKLSNYIIARVSLSSEVDDDFEYLIKIV